MGVAVVSVRWVPRASCRMSDFLRDQSGAVTVDWTVLTAAIVGLGIASAAAVRDGTGALGTEIEGSLSGASVASIFGVVATFNFNDVEGLTRTGWGWRAVGSYHGWTAIGDTQHIEIVESGHRGVHSPDGGNWIDLDASPGNLTLARGLENLNTGQIYNLNFNAADSGITNGVDIYFGGEFVQHVNPTSAQFNAYNVRLIGGAGDGSNQIEFRGTGTANGIGVSLHGIEVR
jgi:Flp pilus assembly pilin Flp